jgi:hypothetical protein
MNDPEQWRQKGSTMATKLDLNRYACSLADQYRAGSLPAVQGKGWPIVWRDLTKELRSRFPGFLEVEYAIALNQGFVNSEQCQSYFEADQDEAIDGVDVPRFA